MTTAVTLPRVVNISVTRGNTGDHRPAPAPDTGIVYIGDRCTQGGWNLRRHPLHNPYKIGRDGTRDQVLAKYRDHLLASPELLRIAWSLRDAEAFGCWCSPLPCHGDVVNEVNGLIAAGAIPIPD